MSLNLDAQKCPCCPCCTCKGLSLKGIIFFEKGFKFLGVPKRENTFIRKCIAYWKHQFHWNRTSDQWIYGYLPVCGPLQAIPNRSMSLQQPRPHDKATPISSQEKWVCTATCLAEKSTSNKWVKQCLKWTIGKKLIDKLKVFVTLHHVIEHIHWTLALKKRDSAC